MTCPRWPGWPGPGSRRGLGFATSRTLNHRSVTGELAPTYDSEVAELAGIAAALGEAGQGVLQLVADFLDVEADLEVILAM